jgi:hypothetical protein
LLRCDAPNSQEREALGEAIARLQDYLKQELTPELTGELRAHLEHCRPCEGYARFERSS